MSGRIEYQTVDLSTGKTGKAKFTIFTNLFKFTGSPKDIVILENPSRDTFRTIRTLVEQFHEGHSINVATHETEILDELDLQLNNQDDLQKEIRKFLGSEREKTL